MRMKPFYAVRQLLKRHPVFLVVAVPLLTLSSCIDACSIMGLAPIIDLLTQPDLHHPSQITTFVTSWMHRLGVPVSAVSVIGLFLLLVIVKNLLVALTRFIVTKLHFRLVNEMMTELFHRFLSARWHFFTTHSYGTLGNTVLREDDSFDNRAVESLDNTSHLDGVGRGHSSAPSPG